MHHLNSHELPDRGVGCAVRGSEGEFTSRSNEQHDEFKTKPNEQTAIMPSASSSSPLASTCPSPLAARLTNTVVDPNCTHVIDPHVDQHDNEAREVGTRFTLASDLALAEEFKEQGNMLFRIKCFDDAIKMYSYDLEVKEQR